MCHQSFPARAPTFPVAGTSPNASLVTPHICASRRASRSRSRSRRGFRFRRHLHDAPSRREARAGSPRRRSARGSPRATPGTGRAERATAVRPPRAGRTWRAAASPRSTPWGRAKRPRRCRRRARANNRTGARGTRARRWRKTRADAGRPRTRRASPRRRRGGRASSSPPGSDARLKRSV